MTTLIMKQNEHLLHKRNLHCNACILPNNKKVVNIVELDIKIIRLDFSKNPVSHSIQRMY